MLLKNAGMRKRLLIKNHENIYLHSRTEIFTLQFQSD